MVCNVRSLGLHGVTGYEVSAECDLSGGLPAFTVVGLPDAAVNEARERVRAAIKNCGFTFPVSRITVNLAPAHLRKAGTPVSYTHLRIPALARSPVLSDTWGHGSASPAEGIPFGRSCGFQGAVVSRQVQFNEKAGLFPYIQEVGKWVRKAEISTLIEICAIMGSRPRGGVDMNIKLTIPERLKDLRIEPSLST